MPQPASSVREFLDAPVLVAIARLVIPILTMSFIGFAGYVGTEVVDVMKSHTKQLNEMRVSMATRDTFITDITRQRDGEIKAFKEAWTDHEQRLRTLSDRLAAMRGSR